MQFFFLHHTACSFIIWRITTHAPAATAHLYIDGSLSQSPQATPRNTDQQNAPSPHGDKRAIAKSARSRGDKRGRTGADEFFDPRIVGLLGSREKRGVLLREILLASEIGFPVINFFRIKTLELIRRNPGSWGLFGGSNLLGGKSQGSG